MAIMAETEAKLDDGLPSIPPIQQSSTKGVAETTHNGEKQDSISEKPALQNNREKGEAPPIASPALPDATVSNESNGFGTEDDEYLEGWKLFAALAGIISVFFLVLLDFSIISTAIPYITSDFHRLQDVGWYASAYQLSSAALLPLSGKLYTYLNAKRTFLLFEVIFAIGSLLCAVSTSSTFFILGRTVAGLGCSGLENGALTLIAGAVPLHKRPLFTGIAFAVGQVGIVVGPLIGGVLTQYATWRWCFWINLPLSAVSGVFLFFTHIPDETLKPPFAFALLRNITPDLDLGGCALFVPTTVMFLLALQWGSEKTGWASPIVIGLFAGSAVGMILFCIWEWRIGERALIPFHVIKRRIVWTSTIQNSFLFVTNVVGSFYVPIYFQAVKGVSPSLSGLYMLPSILSQLLSMIISGALVVRVGYYLPFGIVGGALTAVACGLISTWNVHTPTATWIGYQILFGLRGIALQTALVSVQNAVTPAENPIAIAFLVFVQSILAAVFSIAGNSIFTKTLTRQISILAPTVSPDKALAAGGSAQAVRALLPPGSSQLEGLLLAYAKSVNAVFYLLLGVAIVCFVAAWGMGWVDTRKKTAGDNEHQA